MSIHCAPPQRRRESLLLCTLRTEMCWHAVHLQPRIGRWLVLRLDQDIRCASLDVLPPRRHCARATRH